MVAENLIQSAQAGNAEAFEQILQECYTQMYRFAMRWSQNKEAAEDITQQACLKLAENIQQFRFDAAFSSWLYRMVVNCAHDWERKNRKYSQVDDLNSIIDEQSVLSMSCAYEQSSYLRQVLHRIDKMGKGFKDTAVLVCAEGMSHMEVAQILDVKESTISWRLHEIRKQLKSLDTEPGGRYE